MSRVAFMLCAAVVAFAAPASAQTAYFAAIEDVPLPPGFTEAGAASSFSDAGGRLVIAAAEGVGGADSVRDFYLQSLPQLGWALVPRGDGALMFQRGRQRLGFTLDRHGARTRLGVRLAVAHAPPGD